MNTGIKERNTNNEIELRRNCDRLISIGTGIMAFSVWTVVKIVGLFLYNKQEVLDYIAAGVEADSAEKKMMITYIALVLLAIMLIIVIAIQFYTGASAIAVGRGRSKKKRRMYLVFGVIMLISSVLSVVQMARDLFTGQTDNTPDIFSSSIIVEVTWLILLVEMIYSSIKVRKLLTMGKHSRQR